MVLSMERWIGKVAVVTGASSGLGADIADRLVTEGLQVVGLARRVEMIEERAKNLAKQGKRGKLHAIKVDLSVEQQILEAFKWIAENLGPVHILINNAGIYVPNSLTDGTTEGWKKTFDVNVLALCICTREAIRSMKENGIDGHIVHMNSVTGHKVPDKAMLTNVYSAAKYAVTSLTETLRGELLLQRSGIKITSLSPGLVESEMTTMSAVLSPEVLELLKQQPIMKPEDISDSVIYILSTPPHVQVKEMLILPLGEQLFY